MVDNQGINAIVLVRECLFLNNYEFFVSLVRGQLNFDLDTQLDIVRY